MPDRDQLTQLRRLIAEALNEGECRQLCFDLGLDYDDLGGRGKSENVMELVARMERENRLPDLYDHLRNLRPNIDWGRPPVKSRTGGRKQLFPLHSLPFRRNPNFTGREELLDQLHKNMTAGETTVGVAAITQAIVGMGGVGKTQLALEYCHRHRDDYDLIWWLRADEEPALAADMVQLGREMGLAVDQMTEQAAQVALVRRWLEESEASWLLVFDNADTIAPRQLQTYLPRIGPGRVLITSRYPNWRGTAYVLLVNVFTPDEAVAFLLARSDRFSGPETAKAVTTNEEAGLLAEELGYLPLALEHAGAYVEATGCTLADYRRLLATQRARLWASAAAPDAYHATITTT